MVAIAKALSATPNAENGAHSPGKRGTHQNIRCERPHGRKECQMSLRSLYLSVERWALSVRRFLL